MMFAYPLRNCLPFLRYWPATYRPLDSGRRCSFSLFLGISPGTVFLPALRRTVCYFNVCLECVALLRDRAITSLDPGFVGDLSQYVYIQIPLPTS